MHENAGYMMSIVKENCQRRFGKNIVGFADEKSYFFSLYVQYTHFEISKGFYEPYSEDRFNALLRS